MLMSRPAQRMPSDWLRDAATRALWVRSSWGLSLWPLGFDSLSHLLFCQADGFRTKILRILNITINDDKDVNKKVLIVLARWRFGCGLIKTMRNLRLACVIL